MPHPDSAATTVASRSWRAAVVAAALLLLIPAVAWAQQSERHTAPAAKYDTTVYTYVEQMPVMQKGRMAEIVNYIARYTKFRYCNGPDPIPQKSRIVVEFIVTKIGGIRGARIVQGIGCGNDEAVLAAVRSLPRFQPGRQFGRPVAVKFVMPFTFHFQ